jgi:hypothetical protein
VSTPRDYLHDLRRYYLPKAATRARDAWHQAAGRHIQGARRRVSNWRNRRDLERGRRDIPRRIGDQVRSRTPVLRNRVNRATGRPHRADRHMGRLSDQSLARVKENRDSARYSERVSSLAPRFHPRPGPGRDRDEAARQRLYGDPRGTWATRSAQVRAQGRAGRN